MRPGEPTDVAGSPLNRAYAAPATGGAEGQGSAQEADGPRVAGVLLLIAATVTLVSWMVELFWHWRPRWAAVLVWAAEIGLGAGLLRQGRRWAVPALITFAIAAAAPIVHAWPLFKQGGVVVLIAPVVVSLPQLLPLPLLLIGRVSAGRAKAAVAVFAVGQLMAIAMSVLAVLASRWTGR